MRIKKKVLKNIFAKNRRKNLHKHPGPPFQIRPGPGYFSIAEKTYIKTTKIFAQCGECRVVNVAVGRKLFKRLRKEKKKKK